MLISILLFFIFLFISYVTGMMIFDSLQKLYNRSEIRKKKEKSIFESLDDFQRKTITFFAEIATGYFIVTIIAYYTSWLFHNVIFGSRLAVSILFAISGIYIIKKILKYKKRPLKVSANRKKAIDTIIIILIITLSLLFISSSVYSPQSNGSYDSFWYVWSDFSYHSGLAQSFYYSNNIPPNSQIHPSSELVYPPLADYNIALLETIGISYVSAIRFSGMFVFSMFSVLSYLIFYILFKKRKIAMLGLILVLFLSSLNYYQNAYMIQQSKTFYTNNLHFVKSGAAVPDNKVSIQGFAYESFYHSVLYPIADPQKSRTAQVSAGNIISQILLPQRSFLYGLTFLMAILILLLKFKKNNPKVRDLKKPITELKSIIKTLKEPFSDTKKTSKCILYFILGLLFGLISLYHFHIYVYMLGIFFFLILFFKDNDFVWIFLGILISSIPQIILMLTVTSSHNFLRFTFFAGEKFGSLWSFIYWILIDTNLIYVAFASLSLFSLKKEIKYIFLSILLPSLFSFIMIFQPWNFDNNKFWYILFVLITPFFLITLSEKKGIIKKTAIIIYIILLIAPGLSNIIFIYKDRYQSTNNQIITIASEIGQKFSGNKIFLSSTDVTEPILTIAGKMLYTSYPGWEWTHGFPYKKESEFVNFIYNGYKNSTSKQALCSMLKSQNISYIIFGQDELENYGTNSEKYIQSNLIDVYSSKDHGYTYHLNIYSVKKSCG